MDFATVLGLVAATLTTAAFLPQVLKIVKTRSTKDLSMWMYAMLFVGVLLWLVYGLLISSLPVIAANAVTLVLVFAVLAFKIKYG
jgi:MtN3 and saliva related transmembrane protein